MAHTIGIFALGVLIGAVFGIMIVALMSANHYDEGGHP